MNISTKLLKAAAGAAAGAGLDIDEIFNTFVYNGNNSTQTVTNNIDLSNEGGLVWIKNRSTASTNHSLFDTESGATGGSRLRSNLSNGLHNFSGSAVFTTSSTGFALNSTASQDLNDGSDKYVSWTFRKAPKFFDVVTYTGDGTNGRSVSHNLGTTVGMIILKRTDSGSSDDWQVFHRYATNKRWELNNTDAGAATTLWGSGPTSTNFTVDNASFSNENGATYVAYLFAHNNNDGEFGPNQDQDIIKCGSFTGTSSGEVSVNLGFEPQFIIYKLANNTNSGDNDNWRMHDVMRGWDVNNRQLLNPNQNAAESSLSNTGGYEIKPTATGFIHEGHAGSSGSDYIYMAIRRGPLAAPEDATKVFAIDSQGSTGDGNAPSFRSNFPVDMAIRLDTSGASKDISARLTGAKRLYTDLTNAESSFNNSKWDYQNGWYSATSTITNYYAHMWKRAPSYFDVVAYKSTTSAQALNHNLSAVPEMMWIKNRDDTKDWQVYHSALGNTKYLQLNTTDAQATASNRWNDTSPTATQFTVGTAQKVNDVTTTRNYIAYLFATVANVSKVGSITGNGSTSGDSQPIACGFSSGARFVLIKRTSGPGGWDVFDSVRGIVSGNDPFLALNNTNAETTNVDLIDPTSSGFILNYDSGWMTNISGETYIFYAIA